MPLLLDLTLPADLPARADGNVGAELEFVRFIDALAPEMPDLAGKVPEPRERGAFIAFMVLADFIATGGGAPEGLFLGGMICKELTGSGTWSNMKGIK